jgi:predicted GNAT family N-acyltransferase
MSLQQVETLSESQIVDLHQLYQIEWWTEGRSLGDVRIMLANSDLIIGFVDESGKLVAFCRALTDSVFRATLYDVIVAVPTRGVGLGHKLMDTITQHPRLRRVSKIALNCRPEMVPFYEEWGFVVAGGETRSMCMTQREG